MTLTELITTLGPIGGVALFMWLNRGPQKSEKPDPIAQKLDALIEAMTSLEKSLAILLDRSKR